MQAVGHAQSCTRVRHARTVGIQGRSTQEVARESSVVTLPLVRGDQHCPTAGNDGRSEQGPLFGMGRTSRPGWLGEGSNWARESRRIIRLWVRIQTVGRFSQRPSTGVAGRAMSGWERGGWFRSGASWALMEADAPFMQSHCMCSASGAVREWLATGEGSSIGSVVSVA